MNKFKIADKEIGGSNPIFIVAEISCNHKQDIELAKELVRKAKWAGADAVKMQIYLPDDMTIDCKNRYFKINIGSPWDGRYLYDLYKESYTPYDWYPKLKEVADEKNIILFSSAFSKAGVDYLERHDAPCYKVASFEITDTPLISHMAQTGKPIIMSSGVALCMDIFSAIKACGTNENIAVLKCSSTYPTAYKDVNLFNIPEMEAVSNTIVGLSDHTPDIYTAIASVPLGAKIIEKHIKLLPYKIDGHTTLDSEFSLTPEKFKTMVGAIRNVEEALGEWKSITLTPAQLKAGSLCRSLFVVKDVKRGELLTEDNIRSIRPSGGILPFEINMVIGKTASRNIKKGEPLSWEMLRTIW